MQFKKSLSVFMVLIVFLASVTPLQAMTFTDGNYYEVKSNHDSPQDNLTTGSISIFVDEECFLNDFTEDNLEAWLLSYLTELFNFPYFMSYIAPKLFAVENAYSNEPIDESIKARWDEPISLCCSWMELHYVIHISYITILDALFRVHARMLQCWNCARVHSTEIIGMWRVWEMR